MTDEGIWSAAVKRPLDVNSLGAASIDGVDDADMPMIRALCKVWRDRYPYNLIRSSYYFARYRFKDFGISIPDRIRANVSACVGWPAKAVRALADLSVFDGWDLGGIDSYGIGELADENALELAIPQTIVSAYMHGCAFLTITKDAEGIIVTPRSAEYSAAIWDGRHNRLAAVLTINDATSKGRITAVQCVPSQQGIYRGSRRPWPLGGRADHDELAGTHGHTVRQRPPAVASAGTCPHHEAFDVVDRHGVQDAGAHGGERRVLQRAQTMVPGSSRGCVQSGHVVFFGVGDQRDRWCRRSTRSMGTSTGGILSCIRSARLPCSRTATC